MSVPDVIIRPYSEHDLSVLERTLGNAKEMVHLGGPESAEKILKRHNIFLGLSANPRTGCMFTIVVGAGNSAGTVGYWERDHDGEKAWETGWNVLPEFQGRGIATAATRLVIERLTRLGSRRYLFAYPSVDNNPSNAICRKLGFALVGDRDYEYPPGNILHCNIWRLGLSRDKRP